MQPVGICLCSSAHHLVMYQYLLHPFNYENYPMFSMYSGRQLIYRKSLDIIRLKMIKSNA